MNRYRLFYLGVVGTLMCGAVLVSAESAKARNGRIDFSAFLSLQQATAAGTEDELDRPEPGNLSEVGAKEILTEGDYLAALIVSREKPVLIFKHSTTCEISGGAYRRTAAWLKESDDAKPAVFLVKVIESRPESQFIEKQTQIKHESPQAILLIEGKPVWNRSHEDITGDALGAAMSELDPAEHDRQSSD